MFLCLDSHCRIQFFWPCQYCFQYEIFSIWNKILPGEAGVAAALAAATGPGCDAGASVARDLGAEVGGEVGRVAGQQAAAVAAAEELTKMNMAEITEEKAEQLKATFEELGTRVGSEAGIGWQHGRLNMNKKTEDILDTYWKELYKLFF